MSDTQVKYVLGEDDIPTHWVNLMADLNDPDHPGTAAASSGHEGARRA